METVLKRFLLFVGSSYYPSGGWQDFRGSYDSLEQALIALAKLDSNRDWYDIVDAKTGQIVETPNRIKDGI